jgi:hypothetical protein
VKEKELIEHYESIVNIDTIRKCFPDKCDYELDYWIYANFKYFVNESDVCYDFSIFDGVCYANGDSAYLTRKALINLRNKIDRVLENYDEILEKLVKQEEERFIERLKELEEKQKNVHPKVDINKSGFVYVMKNCGYYKIGMTQNAKSRFGEYARLPEEPEYIILEKVKDCKNVEKYCMICLQAKG